LPSKRIADPHILEERARNVSETALDTHYAEAYGIFSGPATETAILRVAPERARWVADELWHPRQSGKFRDDGWYELRVPYGRPDELILDVLRLGPEIEVLGPATLRQEVAKRLRDACAVYSEGSRRPSPSGAVRGAG
jgi:predicted DNA-binding transcriptional regulator YafY